jgi:hypothetical protein
MEPNSTTPEQGGEQRHPFFISNAPVFRYRVSYTYQSRVRQIEYRSPLEVVLNLRSFEDSDSITYINMDTGKDAFTLTVDRFKFMVAQLVVNSSPDEIEALYVRLLLTNHYSPSIPDRGHLKQIDGHLRRQLAKVTKGVDHYLYGDILYLKYRRLSINHLRAVILDRSDIQLYHINMPSTIPNWWLFRDAMRLSIPDKIMRVYTFSPVSEDNIVDSPIPGIPQKIIRIINNLIK